MERASCINTYYFYPTIAKSSLKFILIIFHSFQLQDQWKFPFVSDDPTKLLSPGLIPDRVASFSVNGWQLVDI